MNDECRIMKEDGETCSAKRTHLWKRSCQAVGARKVREKSPHIPVPVAVGVGFPARRDAPSQPAKLAEHHVDGHRADIRNGAQYLAGFTLTDRSVAGKGPQLTRGLLPLSLVRQPAGQQLIQHEAMAVRT